MEKHIRIERPARSAAGVKRGEWRTVPNCDRVQVWEVSSATVAEDEASHGGKRIIFHIGFHDGIVRGCRVTYYGDRYDVVEVSDSTRLRGLELRCEPIAAAP